MKRLSWAVVAFAAAFGLAGPAAAETATTKITVGTSYPGIDSMPIYVARQNGYFDQEHLSVNLLSLATGDKIVFALLGGSINIARYTPDWIIRADETGGGQLKIVMGGSNTLVFSLISGNAVKSYADLKGQRIGVSTLAAADATLAKKMLAAHGLNKGDYTLIQAGSSPERSAALRAGSLAATFLTPPVDQQVLDDGAFRRLDLSTNVVAHYAWGAEAVRADWAEANKPALLAYMRAWIKAFRWMHDPANKAGAIAILAREAKIQPRYAEDMYDIYIGPKSLQVPPDGKVDVLGYEALLKDMAAQGQIASPPPSPTKYIDESYREAAEASLK